MALYPTVSAPLADAPVRGSLLATAVAPPPEPTGGLSALRTMFEGLLGGGASAEAVTPGVGAPLGVGPTPRPSPPGAAVARCCGCGVVLAVAVVGLLVLLLAALLDRK